MAQINNDEESKNLLLHAVINQLESDFDDNDFDSMDELITKLMENEANHEILIAYLGDSAKENWLEGKTVVRYSEDVQTIPTVHPDDIETFLEDCCDEVYKMPASALELVMDNHFCIKWKKKEYFVPRDSSFYNNHQEKICDYLKSNHSL